jgi:hypothetical protein
MEIVKAARCNRYFRQLRIPIYALLAALLTSSCNGNTRERPLESRYDCYISETGSGKLDGTSLDNAYPWSNGDGLRSCLSEVAPGDTIFLAYSSNYELSERISWDVSGLPDKPIILLGEGRSARSGGFGQSVIESHDQWPTITGTRAIEKSGKDGSSFLKFEHGISHVQVRNLNLNRFNNVIVAGDEDSESRNQAITISDVYVEYAREVISIFGADSNSGSEDWALSRIYAVGISKRLVRAEGLRDSTFSDIYVDTQSPEGHIYFDDWPFLFHFDGPSQNIEVVRAIAKNPGVRRDNYDNGDCFTTESETSNITFDSVRCFDAFDAAFDLKGKNHIVKNAIAFRIGNRAFRIWDGPVTIQNAIAGFDGQGEYTDEARGSNSAIWAKGSVKIENFTSINNTRPYLLEGGKIEISNSILALSQDYADQSLEAQYEGDGEVQESNVLRWVENEQGQNPHFSNASNLHWEGEGYDFNSEYYQGKIGFHNLEYSED